MPGFGLELPARLMQVDLARAEAERGAPGAEPHHFHAEHPRIKFGGFFHVVRTQGEMMNAPRK